MQSDIQIVTLSKFFHVALALQCHYSPSLFQNYRLSKAAPRLCAQKFVSLPSDTISSLQLLNSSNSKSGMFSHSSIWSHSIVLYRASVSSRSTGQDNKCMCLAIR